MKAFERTWYFQKGSSVLLSQILFLKIDISSLKILLWFENSQNFFYEKKNLEILKGFFERSFKAKIPSWHQKKISQYHFLFQIFSYDIFWFKCQIFFFWNFVKIETVLFLSLRRLRPSILIVLKNCDYFSQRKLLKKITKKIKGLRPFYKLLIILQGKDHL